MNRDLYFKVFEYLHDIPKKLKQLPGNMHIVEKNYLSNNSIDPCTTRNSKCHLIEHWHDNIILCGYDSWTTSVYFVLYSVHIGTA